MFKAEVVVFLQKSHLRTKDKNEIAESKKALRITLLKATKAEAWWSVNQKDDDQQTRDAWSVQ